MPRTLAEQVNHGVAALSPYEPGRPIEEIEREYGLSEVIKLASNENPLGPSARVGEALQRAAAAIARYPDGNGFELKNALAAEHAIEARRITLGNGSNDLLCLLGQVLLGPGTNAVMSAFGFAIYRLVALAMNAEIVVADALGSGSDMPYGHDPDALAGAIDDNTRIVFIANPNNPTGTWLEPAAIEALIERIPPQVLVVLDEAYREYLAPEAQPDSRVWLERYPNLVVTRTFSKAYGLAGLRVGYALSSPLVADWLNRVRQPFNVNSVAMAAATAALGDHAHLQRGLDHNTAELPKLRAGIESLGLSALPSQTNFLTFDAGRDCRPVFQGLLKQGVIVRPMHGYGMPQHLRVTAGTVAENERFLEALSAALQANA